MLCLAGTVVGCSPTSGPALWARSCEHLQGVAARPTEAGACERSYAELPTAVADDLALCALDLTSLDLEGTELRACERPAAAAFFEAEAEDQTARRLEALAESLEAHMAAQGVLPGDLAALGLEAIAVDGWGQPLRFEKDPGGTGEKTAFAVCSSGRDGVASTDDDICRQDPEFLYFQF